jgi:hypothetical protein
MVSLRVYKLAMNFISSKIECHFFLVVLHKERTLANVNINMIKH